ncbi:hypothetical protein [Burkholderia ubonensis]|uniref:hypothetical protein n=1 Tax=Burkholderia ubonensis TaxID=101571 RepID=UPI000AA275AC|nr:hypothetical protein [Burkholderia ubonensis]
MSTSTSVWINVAHGEGERRVEGRYKLESGMITVTCAYGTKSTQAGSTPPDGLARLILSEMAPRKA